MLHVMFHFKVPAFLCISFVPRLWRILGSAYNRIRNCPVGMWHEVAWLFSLDYKVFKILLAIQILSESLFPLIKILAIAPWYLNILLLFIFIKVVLFFLKILCKNSGNFNRYLYAFPLALASLRYYSFGFFIPSYRKAWTNLSANPVFYLVWGAGEV